MRYKPLDPAHATFSYHRKSLYPLLWGAFLFGSVLEMVVLHLLLQQWNETVAWVLTGLSIYGILWIVGDLNAARLHPIVLDGDTLHLRVGLRWRATIALEDITSISRPAMRDSKKPGYLGFTLAGEPQMVLELARPVTAHGFFGLTREVSRVGLFVDDQAAFRAALAERR